MKLSRSNHIEEAEHAGDVLTVKFKNGHSYTYNGVSEKEFHALLQAPSPGAFLYAHIRKWHGNGRKMDDQT